MAQTFGKEITQKTITVHCRLCNHEWEGIMPLPMELSRAIKVMKGISEAGCPNCGAHGNDVLCGPKRPETAQPTLPTVPPNREIREGELPPRSEP